MIEPTQRPTHSPLVLNGLLSALLVLVGLATSACEPSDAGHAALPGGAGGRSESGAPATPVEGARGLVVLDPVDPERPTFFDLGRVPLGDVARTTVRLENQEGRALTIRDAIPSCGCTSVTASWRDSQGIEQVRRLSQGTQPITLEPGAVIELALHTDTTIVPAKNAPKLVNVRLRNDSDHDPFLTFELTLIVDKPFEIVPSTLSLGSIPENGDVQGAVQIVCFDPLGLRVTGVAEAPETFEIELTERVGSIRPMWDLQLHLPPPHRRGALRETIALSTSGPHGEGSGRPLEVLVHGDVVGDILASPSRLQFAPFPVADGARAQVEMRVLLSGLRVSIADMRLIGDAADELELSWTARDADAQGRATRYFIDLAAPPGMPPGTFSGHVRVEFEGASSAPVHIPYGGQAVAGE